MDTALATIENTTGAALSTSFTRHLKGAAELAEDSHTKRTQKAYRADWTRFETWCQDQNLTPFPDGPQPAQQIAGMVAGYAHSMTTGEDGLVHKPATIGRALAAISEAYKAKGFAPPRLHPSVVRVMKGIRKNQADAGVKTKKAPAILSEDLRAMVAGLGEDLRGTRDRAMLLVGWICGSRRSELVAVDVEHLTFDHRGVAIYVPKSKTDQGGKGRYVAVHYGERPETCPVKALQAWIAASGCTAGAVFRQVTPHGKPTEDRISDKAVDRMVKRLAKTAGLEKRGFSAHSLRSGLVTEARRRNYSYDDIRMQTGHKSDVIRDYAREEDCWQGNITAGLGL